MSPEDAPVNSNINRDGTPSYPLNSEKARPPGTCKEYLSCAAKAMPPRTASDAATIAVEGIFLLFIFNLPPTVVKNLMLRRSNRACQAFGPGSEPLSDN